MNFKAWLAFVEADNNPMMQTQVTPLDQQATLANSLGDTRADDGPTGPLEKPKSGPVGPLLYQFEEEIAVLFNRVFQNPPDKNTLRAEVVAIAKRLDEFMRSGMSNPAITEPTYFKNYLSSAIGQLMDLKNGLETGTPYNQKAVCDMLTKAHDFVARARIVNR